MNTMSCKMGCLSSLEMSDEDPIVVGKWQNLEIYTVYCRLTIRSSQMISIFFYLRWYLFSCSPTTQWLKILMAKPLYTVVLGWKSCSYYSCRTLSSCPKYSSNFIKLSFIQRTRWRVRIKFISSQNIQSEILNAYHIHWIYNDIVFVDIGLCSY